MSSTPLFGRYYPGTSIVHRLDPRTKLIGTLAFIVAGLFARTPLSLAIVVVSLVLAFAAARIPVSNALRAVLPLLPLVLVTVLLNLFFVGTGTVWWEFGPLRITDEGCTKALFFGIRLTAFIAASCLLTLTTDTMAITDGSEALLRPLGRFGVPVSQIALMAGIALRFIPRFAEEFQQVERAQTARGARLPNAKGMTGNRLAARFVPLFAGIFRRSDNLADAMDARCYRGGEGRSRLHPLAFHRRDAGAALVGVLVLAAIVLTNLV